MCSAGFAVSNGGKLVAMATMTTPAKSPWPVMDAAVVEYKNMRFVIVESPTEGTMEAFIAVSALGRLRLNYVIDCLVFKIVGKNCCWFNIFSDQVVLRVSLLSEAELL